MTKTRAVLVWLCLGAGGCKTNDTLLQTQGGGAGVTGAAGVATGAAGAGTAGATPIGPADPGAMTVGQLATPPATKLPPVAGMTSVVALQDDDSASIAFDPVDGAVDYRVYPLPDDKDITVGTGGTVVVKNAIYRCAGNRESPAPTIDDGAMVGGSAIHTQVDNQTVAGYKRSLADATLGYVYTKPGDGLVPVFAIGDSDPLGDSTCYFARWAASRVKRYTTSEAERSHLLASFGRDDGIAFYVPATADATTKNVYYAEDQPQTQYLSRFYFADGPEANMRTTKTLAFPILASAAPGTAPLMRVFYLNECGHSHDELAVGKERFNRVYKQGDALPLWSLLWTGITGPTTLVVEALASGCPYQGFMSPHSIPSVSSSYGTSILVHPPFVTMDEMRATSNTGEVFINGQHDTTTAPRAIARAFITVTPKPHPHMDFFAAFSPNDTPETFTEVPCGAPDSNCFQTWRQTSPTFDQFFNYVDTGVGTAGLFAYGPVLGEFRVNYADKSSDSNGKYRLTANQKATMSDSAFLHVTMEVDAYSTARRYPQILISDRPAPIQYTLDKGHTIVVQPRGEINGGTDFPVDYELQICKLRTWDVNQQCPGAMGGPATTEYDFHHLNDANAMPLHLAPNEEFGEHASVDHRVTFDVYTSTKRAYLFLDGQPYACGDLPAGGAPTGDVTVTWGDVLYHSGVDHTYAFHAAHMQIQQARHFDNLGFSSGVPAPTWDETRLPCARAIAL